MRPIDALHGVLVFMLFAFLRKSACLQPVPSMGGHLSLPLTYSFNTVAAGLV